MTKTVDFIFDFASPNGYLVHRVLPGIAERTGATMNYIPCLLGGIFKSTGNQAPMLAFANIKNKLAYDMLETRRFIARHKLEKFKLNPNFPVNTLMMMRAAIHAQNEGFLTDYIEVGSRLMWEDGVKMDDPEQFVSAFTDAGLDGKALLEATADPDVKAKLAENTANAVERGAFGIPTFFVGEEIFYGKERLGQLEHYLKD
ncbi:MAG: 2-hydroxychromene-2-carboxylate isomerase [Pseudomonadota bacterium]